MIFSTERNKIHKEAQKVKAILSRKNTRGVTPSQIIQQSHGNKNSIITNHKKTCKKRNKIEDPEIKQQ